MNEQEIIKKLEAQGYDKVWVYEAEPNEVDEEHAHKYDTHLYILSGQIEINTSKTTILLSGDEKDIPRNILHSAKTGPEGCRYIVAEKH